MSNLAFLDGVYFTVEQLVNLHDQPTIAMNIIEESGITKKDIKSAMLKSGAYQDKMIKFIEEYL